MARWKNTQWLCDSWMCYTKNKMGIDTETRMTFSCVWKFGRQIIKISAAIQFQMKFSPLGIRSQFWLLDVAAESHFLYLLVVRFWCVSSNLDWRHHLTVKTSRATFAMRFDILTRVGDRWQRQLIRVSGFICFLLRLTVGQSMKASYFCLKSPTNLPISLSFKIREMAASAALASLLPNISRGLASKASTKLTRFTVFGVLE